MMPWQKPANERHPLELLHGALAWTHRAQMAEIARHGPNLTHEYASLGLATLELQKAIGKLLWEGLDLWPGRMEEIATSTTVLLTGNPGPRILQG